MPLDCDVFILNLDQESESRHLENAHFFREKLASGKTLVGTCITFIDATVTEALTRTLDFVWIDTEHNPLSLERVQGHIMLCCATESCFGKRIDGRTGGLVVGSSERDGARILVGLAISHSVDSLQLALGDIHALIAADVNALNFYFGGADCRKTQGRHGGHQRRKMTELHDFSPSNRVETAKRD